MTRRAVSHVAAGSAENQQKVEQAMADADVATVDAGMDAQGDPVSGETNRDRVRRLLFVPLGFRHPKAMTPEAGRAFLDAVADELAYLSYDDLVVLARTLAPLGQGAAKCFWPDRATFIGWAHAVRPLPLSADPKLLSWFGSVEGPRARDEGALVETFEWFEAKRLPPYTDQARRIVAERAAESARRLQIVAERRQRGIAVDPQDAAWDAWYRGRRAWLEELVAIEREKRGHRA